MTAYYNEIDPYAAQWLRNLTDRNLIAKGDVDERSIVDVKPDDLTGYAQCHFFAGIGGWSYALRLAGWPDDRPVWTGSCPCQPFSAAGQGKAGDDERHLWPAWFHLIAECHPPRVFGEQVEAAIGWGWLDAVFNDLETEGYACGAAVLPACGVGAPHIRQRIWFVAHDEKQRRRQGCEIAGGGSQGATTSEERHGPAECSNFIMADTDGGNTGAAWLQRGGKQRQQPQDSHASWPTPTVHDSDRGGASKACGGRNQTRIKPSRLRALSVMGHTNFTRSQGRSMSAINSRGGSDGQRTARTPSDPHRPWDQIEWLECSDGKARPTQPRLCPLAYGVQRRASKLRAYGNAIVPPLAAEFIMASTYD